MIREKGKIIIERGREGKNVKKKQLYGRYDKKSEKRGKNGEKTGIERK